MSDGRVRKICLASRKQGVFQVQVEEGKKWEPNPRRVWAEKVAKASPPAQTPQAVPRPAIRVQRTPVADRPLEELQALFFQTPVWLESDTGVWVIMPQIARH